MGLLTAIKSCPVLIRIALFCLLVANVSNGIAFSTTSWGEYFTYKSYQRSEDDSSPRTHLGLWRICAGSRTGYRVENMGLCVNNIVGTTLGWMACVQAMAVFGFAGILGSLILMMAYLLGKKNPDYLLLAAFICIITAVLYLIGVIIFAVKFNATEIAYPAGKALSWSFGLAVVSIILELLVGVLLLAGRKEAATSPS